MASDLGRLLRDASVLAEQLRQERAKLDGGAQGGLRLRDLERQMQQTWAAIRLARIGPEIGPDIARRNPKWG